MRAFDNDFSMTIGGVGIPGSASLAVIDPATEEMAGLAPDATQEELDRAVSAARAAFAGWRTTPLDERRAGVAAIGAVLHENADAFARLFTLEQGRPLERAKSEILAAAWWCHKVTQREIPVTVNEDSAERYSETRHVAIGTVGAIVPWNFPVLLGIWKIAPALLTGNTLVVKPSPFTPLTMLKLGELMRDRLPAGVLNVVSGGDNLGPWLTAHPGIDKVTFTGSTATGKRVMASAAESLKRITLELGGNDAAIVMPDVDVAEVAEKLFWSAFANSGQICVATKRMYIHEAIYEPLSRALASYAAAVKVGNGLAPDSALGPVQNRIQFERVKKLIADARSAGLNFLTGGEVPEGRGFFVPVTIIDNPPDDSPVVTEEAFGPVLPLLRFSSVEEVVRRANDSEYGLAGSVWTKDTGQGIAIASQLETGTVWINEFQHLSPDAVFGGHKQSGFGVENGLEGLLEYTNAQTITINKQSRAVV